MEDLSDVSNQLTQLDGRLNSLISDPNNAKKVQEFQSKINALRTRLMSSLKALEDQKQKIRNDIENEVRKINSNIDSLT